LTGADGVLVQQDPLDTEDMDTYYGVSMLAILSVRPAIVAGIPLSLRMHLYNNRLLTRC